jgi:hypothetical protein
MSDARSRSCCRKRSQKRHPMLAANAGRSSRIAVNSVPSSKAYDCSRLPLAEQNVNQLAANVKVHFPRSARNREIEGLLSACPQQPRPVKLGEAYRQICYHVSRYMNVRRCCFPTIL